MDGWSSMGRFLLGIGAIFILMGLFLTLGGKFFKIGRLPGDIFIQKGNFTFSFPIMTGIILSILLTIILNIILRR